MRKLWIMIFSVLAFGLGAFVAIAYKGATSSLAGIHVLCDLLNTAESAGLLSKEQRADVVARTARQFEREAADDFDQDAVRFLDEFETGCPKMPNFKS
jgi:hypothetical protein